MLTVKLPMNFFIKCIKFIHLQQNHDTYRDYCLDRLNSIIIFIITIIIKIASLKSLKIYQTEAHASFSADGRKKEMIRSRVSFDSICKTRHANCVLLVVIRYTVVVNVFFKQKLQFENL